MHMHMYVCLQVPTRSAAQPHLKGVRVCSYCFANPSTVSVCLSVHVRPCVSPRHVEYRTEGGKHNRTPTQVHTSWYSRHLYHILESVGRHRRDILRRKIQGTAFRGAGACAHERRTGVVAGKGAAAKGHCPRYGRARDGALVLRHSAHLQDTDRRALQLVLGQIKFSVSRRNIELGRQLAGILRKANKQKTYTCTYVCMYATAEGCACDLCMCALVCADSCRVCS
jgi:hypothetical protein